MSIKIEDLNEEYQRLLDLKGLEDQIKAHPKYEPEKDFAVTSIKDQME